MGSMHALRDVLRSRDFRRLFSVRIVAQFGDGLLQASLATFVLFSPEREPDPVRVAAAFAILLLPFSIIGPFAGVFLDRWSRRNVLVRANILKALTTVIVLAVVMSGDDGLVLGVSVLIVLGIGRFVLAGLSASLPHVVSGPDLVTANALTPTAGTIAAAVGGVVGITLRSVVGGGDAGSQFILMCAIACYLVAGFIATRMAVGLLGPHGEKPIDSVAGVVRGLISGVGELREHARAGRAITVVAAHRIAFGVLLVGGLLLVRNTFNDQADADAALGQFAILTGFTAAGALIAAIITPNLTRHLGAVNWSAIALVQAGTLGIAAMVIGATAPAFSLVLAGGFSIGFAGQAVKVCSDTLVQQNIPDDHLGRVFALFDMIVNVSLVAGVTVMALLSPISGQAPVVYTAMGALLLLTAAWYFWRGKAPIPASP
jgi:MFS family permease